jgi:hypothetical protein
VLRRGVTKAIGWIVPSENPSGVIYGVIVIGALLAAESGRHESYLDTVASALIAASLYWLAHAYASVLGGRLTDEDRLTGRALLRALAHDWALVRGAAIPLVAIVLAGAVGAPQETAVNAGLWSAVASLVALELIAGIRSRAAPAEIALELCVGMTMGLAILALKIILH